MHAKAHIIHVGKAQLAFGLQWSTLPGVGKHAHEVNKLVKDNQAQFVTVFQRNESSKAMVGLLGNSKDKKSKKSKDKNSKDKSNQDKNVQDENVQAESSRATKSIKSVKGKILSAAVLFARAVPTPNAMFVYRFPDDSCVFIGILDGVPMPGYDSCGRHVLRALHTLLVGVHPQEEEQGNDGHQANDGDFFGVHERVFLK